MSSKKTELYIAQAPKLIKTSLTNLRLSCECQEFTMNYKILLVIPSIKHTTAHSNMRGNAIFFISRHLESLKGEKSLVYNC